MKRKARTLWTYKGVNVFPADRNASGIRWYARMGLGFTLRADTKESMRHLITHEVDTRRTQGVR